VRKCVKALFGGLKCRLEDNTAMNTMEINYDEH
jgi:hypothetical protein